jgi:hypothetical protein
MGKPGPKRKEGERYPSGDLKPAKVQPLPPAPPPRAIVNIRDLALRKATDPRLGSAIGLLWMSGEVTRQEYRTGLAYARLRGRHDRVLDAPKRHAASPDYGTARSGFSRSEPLTDDDVEAIRADFRGLQIWIQDGLPLPSISFDECGNSKPLDPSVIAYIGEVRTKRIVAMLDRVLVDDTTPEWAEKELFRSALQRMAIFFDIPADRDDRNIPAP